MAAPRLALVLVPALALAFLPSAHAQVGEVLEAADPVFDLLYGPDPRECGGFAVDVSVDSGCTFWACHSDEPLRGCEPYGCPGHWDCEQVVCDLYVETPFLAACYHDLGMPAA